MRKITEQSVLAFSNDVNFKLDNTRVEVENGNVKMFLHGNLIAIKDKNGKVSVSNCGWSTPTTKERLNGVLALYGKGIYQKKGVWYFQDNTVFNSNTMICIN